ncbi:histidine phosphatase family protein [Cupriavidus alkaliphilus]|uniref:histidine phosphatase family protein n=1 Tax=Cupriavidus alkaliphilus TaxID=942866 RepID=UPI000DC559EC|nr:histidine phosphatase family protein [Cupriavidus alkaliphilus]MBB2918742.1 putative phosphoglycerate mutase [Cupriavidus alkaliphilus]MBB3013783.1 putative phosphoglycerate mutase [Cupriavidus alkaliphilus]RAS12387.1 phosphoglycerate mutase [Cupriavidus alkaliphilus]
MSQSPGPHSLAFTHLIVIRHGETAWNRERRLQGQLDIPLNDTGHAQARALATALAGEPIDAVYASDLSRAMETAAPLAEALGLQVRADARLRERSYGALQGKTYAEVAEHLPEDFARWQARVPDYAPPEGESLLGFHERAVDAVLALSRRHPGERIALVAHGGVLDCLYREATGMTLEAPRQHELLNASVNRLRSDSTHLTLAQWGDVSHLENLALDEVDRRVP